MQLHAYREVVNAYVLSDLTAMARGDVSSTPSVIRAPPAQGESPTRIQSAASVLSPMRRTMGAAAVMRSRQSPHISEIQRCSSQQSVSSKAKRLLGTDGEVVVQDDRHALGGPHDLLGGVDR